MKVINTMLWAAFGVVCAMLTVSMALMPLIACL